MRPINYESTTPANNIGAGGPIQVPDQTEAVGAERRELKQPDICRRAEVFSSRPSAPRPPPTHSCIHLKQKGLHTFNISKGVS